jgi:HEAT repeat protein
MTVREEQYLPPAVALTMALALALTIGGGCEAGRSDGPAPQTPVVGERAAEPGDYTGLPEPLRQALLGTHSPLAEDRVAALRALLDVVDPRALPRLLELLEDDDSRVRCQATEAIGRLGVNGREADASLATLLSSDPAAAVRQCALLGLARIGGDLALESLLAFLGAAGAGEVEDAVDALGRLGRIEAVPAVVPHLESSEPSLVRTVVRALSRIGPGGAAQVRPYLDSSSAATRCAAASVLANLESLEDDARLRRMARQDSNPRVRLCALGALGRLGDAASVQRLADLIGSAEPELRAAAAEALGVAATGSAIRALIRSLTAFHADDTPNPAQAALLRVGAPARAALEEALPSGPPLRRALVAETLGLLGDPDASWSLERAALDTDPTVRAAALSALEVLRALSNGGSSRSQR